MIHRSLILVSASVLVVLTALFTFVSIGVALFIGMLVGVFFLSFVHGLSKTVVGAPDETVRS